MTVELASGWNTQISSATVSGRKLGLDQWLKSVLGQWLDLGSVSN
jgi:hypothetical protein